MKWSLLGLWWHCLLRFHRMSWYRLSVKAPKVRFCWECDAEQIFGQNAERLFRP